MTLAGLDNGGTLMIKAARTGSTPLVLLLPKGSLEFKLGAQPVTIITVAVPAATKIDLRQSPSGEVKVPQSGKTRVLSGSVDMDSKAGQTAYGYHDFRVGVSASSN